MVSSVGGFSAVNFAAMAGLNRPAAKQDDLASAIDTKPSAADTFKDYMKKSPAERMVDNWMKAHGLDKAKLDAMSPEDRDAVMKQMEQDIQDQLKQQAETKGQLVNLTA